MFGFIGNLLGGAKLYLILGAVVAVILGGFYLYYIDSQKKIRILIENNAKLELAVQTNEETIKTLQADYEKQSQVLTQTYRQFEDARKLASSLQEKLSKHEIGALAQAKPGLVENIVNNATANANRCMEILSGSPLTQQELKATKKSEINNECPAIANPNYIPSP